MPQLDFSVFPSQFFWLVVNFGLMLFIMSKFIIPKTAEMINLRKEKIEGDLQKAAEIKQQVEATIAKYNEALRKANSKASISLQKTRDELNETINRRQSDISAKLSAEIEAGEERIASSKAKALQKIEDVSVDLAIDILGKLNVTGAINGDSKAAEVFADNAKIVGEVVSDGSVKVGQSSVIIGNITATSAVIAGAVKGDIDVQGPVILDASAIVMGNIKSKSVQINNGAVIEGMCSQCYADVNPTSFFEVFKDGKK